MTIDLDFHWRDIIRHCITGIDGVTIDPARVYGGIAIFTFFGLSTYSVVVTHAAWDAQAYGIGFGALLAGFGLGVQIKASTEPRASSSPDPKGGGAETNLEENQPEH